MPNRGFPVVLSDDGTPFVSVEKDAPYARVADNGLGAPIKLVSEGAPPIVLSSPTPNPINPGPLEVIVMEQGGFNDFSHDFELASSSIILELACSYDGDPTVEIAHEGEPLTILTVEKANGLLALVACGRNMTVESGTLTIKSTGGNCNQGAVRVNEMSNIQPALSGWEFLDSGTGVPLPQIEMRETNGGIVKGVFVNRGADHNHFDHVDGAETIFDGFFMAGDPVGQDFSVNGPWDIGTGWSIVGDRFVHTGNASGVLKITHPPMTNVGGVRAYGKVTTGRLSLAQGSTSTGLVAGGEGLVSTAISTSSTSNLTELVITANGNCEVWDISVVKNGYSVAWVFFEATATDGSILQPVMAYRPGWVFNAVEVLGTLFTG